MLNGLVDDRRQPRTAIVRLVQAVAVGGLEQQHVGLGDRRGVGKHRPVVAAEIAAEQHRLVADRHPRVGGAEQMAGIEELDLHSGHDRNRPLVADRLKLRQRAGGIELGVERQRGRVLRVAAAVGQAGVLFLNVRGVWQDERAQVAGPGGAEDAAAKSAGDETRQVAAMVEVRVSQHHGVDAFRVDGKRRPVPHAQLFQALKQPAIDEHAAIAKLQQMLRPGDGPGGAEKRQSGHSMTILEVMRRVIRVGWSDTVSDSTRQSWIWPRRHEDTKDKQESVSCFVHALAGRPGTGAAQPSPRLLLLTLTAPVVAQQKRLSLDDIYDPGRRVSFSGVPAADITWIDGTHFASARRERKLGQGRCRQRRGDAVVRRREDGSGAGQAARRRRRRGPDEPPVRDRSSSTRHTPRRSRGWPTISTAIRSTTGVRCA